MLIAMPALEKGLRTAARLVGSWIIGTSPIGMRAGPRCDTGANQARAFLSSSRNRVTF
ncbi:hypothetical protein K32_27060 [Kaistia sp. 32K]|uniref:hypothetical protein n=1 Tax=Kaistia sp. 32K TaxID=2795690 RepID=UPI0019159B6A|nr:hypothetical protein [Kaistia sp. 32K]BCP54089.1 hypothetical protein K32_27060 [Kaistia sp. 32K]